MVIIVTIKIKVVNFLCLLRARHCDYYHVHVFSFNPDHKSKW